MFTAILAISKRVEGGGGSRNDIKTCVASSGAVALACWVVHTGTIEGMLVCSLCNCALLAWVRSKTGGSVIPAEGGAACLACGMAGCTGGCCV
jgi:hypothetical protein